ncbi:putative quinol monooxygenase [Mycolicibacter sinensis]|jgi:quinol monooxygenase YgiN|uniref:Antibiotic biosynthesis monooxygenase n=1 Tax=Mycolicibacter sinensis (strain JDM601) TaxID=875328 RepID=A0A1A2EQ55_MYCSD|nr:putative quinol monooxygenase [Mycolicibacter sinensis]OBG06245.1 antibiotic biosynthesis monooxygenase [Mycolicibacter sinensis]OBG07058.1 antibiotic biosynthesis monooxygenase [Mycolicibacter sinensis]
MPVIVVATFPMKPESMDIAREICTKAAGPVHEEPGCQLYSVHEGDGSFVFIEQWADAEALQTHSAAPAVAEMFGNLKEHLAGAPDIKMLQPLPAGDPAKGQLRGQ